MGDQSIISRGAGISMHHALPGVGKHFQDHFLVRVSCDVQGIASMNERSRGLRLAGEVMRYVLTGRGLL